MASILPEYRVRLKPRRPADPDADSLPSGQRTKLGGLPDWVQADETPSCPDCAEEMVFVAQIDSIGGEYMFGDAGMLYLFYCDNCHQALAAAQCF